MLRLNDNVDMVLDEFDFTLGLLESNGAVERSEMGSVGWTVICLSWRLMTFLTKSCVIAFSLMNTEPPMNGDVSSLTTIALKFTFQLFLKNVS